MSLLAAILLGAALLSAGLMVMSVCFLWRYLSWIHQRRQFYLEHGHRRRK